MSERASVGKPDITGGGCWVLVRRYTGSLMAQSTSCGNRPMAGCVTCWHHRHLERDAQGLKAFVEKGRVNG